MKKILAVNIGKKKFSEEFDASCRKIGIEYNSIRALNCVFLLSDNKAKLFSEGKEIDLTEIGYCFIRVRGKFPLMISLVTKFLKNVGVPFNDAPNNEHTESEEKVTQMLQMTLANIPIPKTILFTLEGFNKSRDLILSNTNFPCVLKTNGSKGRNVWKINSLEDFEAKLADISGNYEVVMVQEFIPNTFDIRTIYLFGVLLGAIKRSSADGFYNNVSKGGSTEKIELTSEEIQMSIKASVILGRDFGGVDIVRSTKGPLLLEVNMGPQVYGFENATGIDVPNEIVSRIKEDFLSGK